MAGKLIYYKCMNPHILQSTVMDSNIVATGTSDTELKIGQDTVDYNSILHVDLLPKVNHAHRRGDLTFVINVAGEGPKPTFYDPLAVCITDLSKVIGIQLRDPSEYAKKELGPYMGFKALFGKTLSPHPDEIPCNEADCSYDFTAHRDWLRWPQMFNIKLKPKPPSAKPNDPFSTSRAWGLCSSSINGGISRSFDLGDPLDVDENIHLVLYRKGAKETYTLNMIEVAVYEDAP